MSQPIQIRIASKARVCTTAAVLLSITSGLAAWPTFSQAVSLDEQQTSSQQKAAIPAPIGTAAHPGEPDKNTPAQTSQAIGQSSPSRLIPSHPDARVARAAENAYLKGAKELTHADMEKAKADFEKAHKLDPGNETYSLALSIATQDQITQLVHQATAAQSAGDSEKAAKLILKARSLDPTNPIVQEHSSLVPQQADLADPSGHTARFGGVTPIAHWQSEAPWKIDAPVLAGAIVLQPTPGTKSFDERGTTNDVVRAVTSAFGIRVMVDESVKAKNLRFQIDNVTYAQAMSALMDMAHLFCVPMDSNTVLIADDTEGNRTKFQHLLQETIEVPGGSTTQLNEIANVLRVVFEVKQTTVQTNLGSLVIRAPQDLIGAINTTVQNLLESSEILLDIRLYEVDSTLVNNIGATLPMQFSAFNVDQAASQIVSNNQALVQQAIAQGYISSTASNLQIALALIGSGLVQSNLASNLIGVFGGGALQTGVSASTNATFNFARNSADTRILDNVQLRVGDHQTATFRAGTKYPIISSTYSSGISPQTSGLSNATVNGVNVSSLLSQYAGAANVTIPQVTYEDLGITLNATPIVQKSNRVYVHLELKIESLAGSSSNGMPVLQNRQFNSDMTLNDGECAMMVSTVNKAETTALNGFPGLSELPGFQMPISSDVEHDKSELVVLVTPHVLRKRSSSIAGPRIPVPYTAE